MNKSNRWIKIIIFIVFLLSLNQSTGAQEAQKRAFARKWTCDATISLIESGKQYTPQPWEMTTKDPHTVWGDREKSCKKYIEAEILTGNIWKKLNLTPAEQDKICKKGEGDFRVDYGFDERPKSWSFTKTLPAPPCDCELICKTGYNLDTSSSPGHPRCVRLLCSGSATGIPDDRFGPHDNGIGIWHGNVYHHQPVRKGHCVFQGSNSEARWTSWLNRDGPGGSGDFEGLKDFVQSGQACSHPKEIRLSSSSGG